MCYVFVVIVGYFTLVLILVNLTFKLDKEEAMIDLLR